MVHPREVVARQRRPTDTMSASEIIEEEASFHGLRFYRVVTEYSNRTKRENKTMVRVGRRLCSVHNLRPTRDDQYFMLNIVQSKLHDTEFTIVVVRDGEGVHRVFVVSNETLLRILGKRESTRLYIPKSQNGEPQERILDWRPLLNAWHLLGGVEVKNASA